MRKGQATMQVTDEREPVERLYQRLTDALLQARAEPFTAPVTVAEIYQELVPYRLVRGEIGFSMNADYEHALLRLLGGEGEWVQLEPASAREVILRELQSPNPNVSIYRDYAGCDAWVRPRDGAAFDDVQRTAPIAIAEDDDDADDWMTELLGADTDDEAAAPGAAGSTFALAEPQAEAEPEVGRRAGAGHNGATEETAAAPAPAAGAPAAPSPSRPRVAARCVFCDSGLPTTRAVRFCPYCGGDQSMRPCGACGEVVEPGWAFCVACGAGVEDG
jgi:hypothetical protein